MKFPILLLSFLFACNLTSAQTNLVKNPSFEEIRRCPANSDQIRLATHWSPIDTITYVAFGDTFGSANCTPELCHTCSSNGAISVPVNAHFTHYPRTGNGMAQVQMYCTDTTFTYQRDYLQGALSSTLVAGKQYCVTFYVLQEPGSGFSIDHIGAYLDDRTIDTTTNCGLPQATHIPQVYTSAIISDTTNWTKIQGSFTATGRETAITIGNFFYNVHTDTTCTFFPRAYGLQAGDLRISWYLVDDVSVIPTDAVANAGHDTAIRRGDSCWVGNHDGYVPTKWYKNGVLIDSNTGGFRVKPDSTTSYVCELEVCGTITRDTVKITVGRVGIADTRLERVLLYPNPVSGALTIEGAKGLMLSIYDLVGRCVSPPVLAGDIETVYTANLVKGVYMVEIVDVVSSEKVVRKVVKE